MAKNDLIPVVAMHDPALAGCRWEDVERYARTREPRDLPESPDGAQPVTFWFRRLRRSQVFDFVELTSIEAKKHARAFAAGVVKITGGRFGDGWSPEGADAKGYLAMTEDELDWLDLAPADLMDVGQVIYLRSVAPFGSTVRYPLLPTSLAVWEGSARLYAERNPGSAARSSAPPKDG